MCEPFSAINREKCREIRHIGGTCLPVAARIQCLFGPFPANRNRELSGNILPTRNQCSPLLGGRVHGTQTNGVPATTRDTRKLILRPCLGLESTAALASS